jgi:predicted RNA-binding Zn-ribbon protein involved in translation (DUF1610 family)
VIAATAATERICANCGESLAGRRAHARFCGPSCRAATWRAASRTTGAARAPRKRSYDGCVHCGAGFASRDQDGIWLCGKCGRRVGL